MAIKLKVSETSAKLKATSTDALQFGVEQGIPIYPDPYEGSYEVTPTEAEQTLETKDLMMTDDVTVGAIPSDYVGSGIDRRDSSDLTSSGATVSVPSGFYEENASKSIPSGTVVPAGGIQAIDATLTASNNKLSLYRECINAPYVSQAGYIESGTQGTTKITLTADVNTRTSSDLTASGNTVTAPAGYYPNSANKTIPNAELEDEWISSEYYTDDGERFWSTSAHYEYSSGGYISAGTYHISGEDYNAVASGTTITPSTSSQTVGGANYMMEGAVTINPIPSNYGLITWDGATLTVS